MAQPTSDALILQVLTFKEGLLSKVAHDLRLNVTGFTLNAPESGGGAISLTIPVRGIQVEGAMRDGRLDPGGLSASDRRKIEKAMVKDVLGAKRNPTLHFEGDVRAPSDGAPSISGRLTLNGQTRALSIPLRREGDRFVADVPIHQPDFGIRPYSALLGTLKVKAGVRILITISASSLGLGDA